MEFRVGTMVVGAVLALVIMMAIFGVFSFPFQRTYTIYVTFPSAPGLSAGAPVRKSGVRIGEVSDVDLTADGHVRAALKINSRYPLYDNEVCRLQQSLLGDTWLEFEPARTESSGRSGGALQSGATAQPAGL